MVREVIEIGVIIEVAAYIDGIIEKGVFRIGCEERAGGQKQGYNDAMEIIQRSGGD